MPELTAQGAYLEGFGDYHAGVSSPRDAARIQPFRSDWQRGYSDAANRVPLEIGGQTISFRPDGIFDHSAWVR